METIDFKAISKYSVVRTYFISKLKETSKLGEILFNTTIENKLIHLQIIDDILIVEYIPKENMEQYIGEKAQPTSTEQAGKSKEEQDIENALDTVLNNDPRGKYNGCLLRDIFDNHDNEWVEWCLKNMHNEFIRSRVELIKNSGYKGGD